MSNETSKPDFKELASEIFVVRNDGQIADNEDYYVAGCERIWNELQPQLSAAHKEIEELKAKLDKK